MKRFIIQNKKLILIILVILVVTILVIPSSFAASTPVEYITFSSKNLNYEKKDEGSWNLVKSAKWLGKGKARITFNINTNQMLKDNVYRDVILVVDNSSSMIGEKLNKVKSDSVDLVNSLLEDSNNRLGLISFSGSSTILSGLTNNSSELISKINDLTANGNTNYYQALVKVDELLKSYKKENNRECVVLFLTDGYPNINTPNEMAQYRYLKKEYSYLNINGIQYEMGNTILEEIRNISDKQYIANMDTLNNVLLDASLPRISYDNFEVTDYINDQYFDIDSVDDITVSDGSVSLDGNQVRWNLDGISSGSSVTMTIDIQLKDEYINEFSLYQTNIKEEVSSEINGIKEEVSETDTPILSNSFTVTYDKNTPEGGLVVGDVPNTKEYSVFDTVEISNDSLSCDGYQFQGWEVVNKEDVDMIGSNAFQSSGENITLKAIWTKVSIQKSMDGVVYQGEPIIKEIPNLIYSEEFWDNKYKQNITKIVIENELKSIEAAEEFWDVSEASDGSVMAYAVLNEDGSTYTIYIQGPGKIIANENSANLFSGFTQLQSIEGLEYLDTSYVTDMRRMFDNCKKLISLDLSTFNTSNVTNMMSMFSDCSSLTSLKLDDFDTSKVTDMNNMFKNCEKLINLDLSSFDISMVINMSYMFQNCSSLKNIILSSFNTLHATHMTSMFEGCSSLVKLDLSSFNMENVLYTSNMFFGCQNLTEIDFKNATFNSILLYENMFPNTSNLEVIVKDEAARSWMQSRLGSSGTAVIASS